MRLWKRLLVYAAGIYCAWAVALWFYQGALIFPVGMIPKSALKAEPPPGATVIRGATMGWLLPPTKSIVGFAPLAVYFHGNAEIIDQLTNVREVRLLRSMGFAVLMVEYPGYGHAGGNPSQQGIVDASTELIDLAAARPEIDPTRVLYVGKSLGGGAACAVAEVRPPRAMILLCTFRSIASFAHGMGVPEWLVKHPFRNEETLAKLDVPVLIVHGDRDTIVPVAHGRELARIARQGVYVEQPGAGHLDLPTDWAGFERAVRELVDRAGLAAR